MTSETAGTRSVVPAGAEAFRPTAWQRVAFGAVAAALRVTLLVSPRPTCRLVRRLFARSTVERSARQLAEAPPDVHAVLDERYGDGPLALLDVYVPGDAARAGRALPVVVWTHGGAFVGGTKDELGGYLRTLAARGFAVVAVGYDRAPEARYPGPVRQVVAALDHVVREAGRLHVDPSRVVLAGDSAGAQVTAQVAAALTDPPYGRLLGVDAPLAAGALRGVVLCCGIFDLAQVSDEGPFRHVLGAIGWAYSGSRRFRDDAAFIASVDVGAHVTAAFPPAFVTVGGADPLEPQSRAFAALLAERGVAVEGLFYDGEGPPLGHEYQLELDTEDGAASFERIVSFVRARVGG
ncbi:alpha/beta hydrolase [Luteimicrobium sp. NPDC057192]|uniref:alpha/beta hydrolase n=1 Tax=Luteimicrobium sp. NPDC057192 TaxID=3346042 RepID=UPI00363E8C08